MSVRTLITQAVCVRTCRSTRRGLVILLGHGGKQEHLHGEAKRGDECEQHALSV